MGFQKIPFGSFTTGMVSTDDFTGSSLEGRSDTKLYQSAARTMQNFLPLVTGAGLFRPGFKYVDTNPHMLRLVPFEHSPGLSYIFNFLHNGQMSVYRLDSGVPVLTAPIVGHPYGPQQLARLRWTQWGPIWIGFCYDVPPVQITRNSDSSWNVQYVPFSPVIQWSFDGGATMEDAWSATRGYPTCGCMHQDRLIMGGTPSLPGAVFGSVIGQYTNFTEHTPLQPDDAFAFTMASDANEIVLDLQSFNDTLLVNTATSEWVERSQPLNSSNVNFQKQTQHGMLVTGVRPENVDSGNAFVDRRSTMRISNYDYNAQAYEAEDMNTLTPGLLLNPTASAFIRKFLNSSNLFVFRQSSGISGGNTLAVLTYDKKAAVAGWSLMVAGAGLGFLEVCAVNDQLYALMYDGLGSVWFAHLKSDVYLDLWATQSSGSPQTSWSGFGHLANKICTVIDNTGGVTNNVVVNGSGAFSTPTAVTQIWVGIPYNGVLETMPICPIEDGQIMRGEPVRKVFADIILRRTSGLVVDDQIVTLDKFGPNLLDQFTPPVNTTIRVLLEGVDTEPTVRITNHGPWPCQVLGIGVGVRYRSPPR